VNNQRLREKLRREMAEARGETDRLFAMIAPKAIHERPIAERHRVIFYLGHLEAFDWNMICATSFGMPSFNAQFDRLFEFGIDPVDGELPSDQPSDWPAVREILSYRDRIRSTVDDVLDRVIFEDPAQPFVENGQIFRVAIEHRLMHAETLAYMFHWLDYDLKHPTLQSKRDLNPSDDRSHIGSQSVRILAGETTLGQKPNGDSFGWDNEFAPHSVFVPEFSIDTLNVTNADFLEFVRAGGYQHRSLWSDEGWTWIQQAGIQHPKFWVRRGEVWFYRTMFEEIPLPANWPVYVSHAEASAYARWKEKSLPTEAQYHRAAFGSPDGSRQPLPKGNFDFQSWSPDPAGAYPDRASGFAVYDLVGNGWEWTSTPFAPFEGFEPFPFYRGYSANFFDGKHFVLKGASPRTAAVLVRKSFRNWFQAYYPNIYATFRCVQ
jgi:ergothioneine biosynthesis protein EgtB